MMFLYPMLVGVAMMLPLWFTANSTGRNGIGLTSVPFWSGSIMYCSWHIGTVLLAIVTPIVALVEVL